METINIVGVNCRVDKLATFSYEQLFDLAISSMSWKGIKDAHLLIDKELRENGFKPTQKNRGQTQANQPKQDRTTSKRRGSKKRKRDS